MKNRINYPLYLLVQWTWGAIQNLLGAFLYLFLIIKDPRRKRGTFFGSKVISWKLDGSAAIGMFIFLDDRLRDPTRVLVHEFGHTIQSCILGPFYLLVIGIPSLLWANLPMFRRNRRRGRYTYSRFYPEAWANRLGRKHTGLPSIDR